MMITELTVREHQPTQNDTYVFVDMTDDTDGPVTRVQKFVTKEQLADYPVGARFRLEPVDGE